ncbi:MAG: hypothetical protein DRH10_07050 [Deltaproteobacteria bacterium]|nr:MAG: hypothetical protein DRH10_07050 [Deltaproteobacteria bacterium]
MSVAQPAVITKASGRIPAWKNAATKRSIVLTGGAIGKIPAVTVVIIAASFVRTTPMRLETLLRAMRYMIDVTGGMNTGMIDGTGMKTTGITTTCTTILPLPIWECLVRVQ